MRRLSIIFPLLASSLVFVGGCAGPDSEDTFSGDPVDVSLEETTWGGVKDPPSGYNGLLPRDFWEPNAQHALRELGGVGLGSGGVTVVSGVAYPTLPTSTITSLATQMSTHPIVIKDVIECALNKTDKVYDPVTRLVYSGWWGLAPGWLNAAMTLPAKQKWVTGCMIARLNSLGVHVDILLEGATPPIGVNSFYNPIFSFNESTVDGNLFASSAEPDQVTPAFKAYLCREKNLTDVCPGASGRNWIDKRLCDDAPTKCGIVDIGPCDPAVASAAGLPANCTPNGEHWECKNPPALPYVVETVGIQLFEPVTNGECM